MERVELKWVNFKLMGFNFYAWDAHFKVKWNTSQAQKTRSNFMVELFPLSRSYPKACRFLEIPINSSLSVLLQKRHWKRKIWLNAKASPNVNIFIHSKFVLIPLDNLQSLLNQIAFKQSVQGHCFSQTQKIWTSWSTSRGNFTSLILVP